MQCILQKLYNGDLALSEHPPEGEPYTELKQNLMKLYNELKPSLTDAGQAKLDELLDHQITQQAMAAEEAFEQGFVLCLRRLLTVV